MLCRLRFTPRYVIDVPKGVSCDYSVEPWPVLYADPTIACWRGGHAVLGALCLIAFAYYVPLSIMIGVRRAGGVLRAGGALTRARSCVPVAAPMLMEPDPKDAKDVTYVKLYLMVVNIIKWGRAGGSRRWCLAHVYTHTRAGARC